MEETKKNPITEGVIWKEMMLFCIPIMLGTLVQQLYNMVDVMVVGHFVGTIALAAVGGSASMIIYLVTGFFTGLCGGITVVVSQACGENNQRKIHLAVHTTIALSLVGGVLLSILGYVFTPFLLNLMDTPEETMEGATLYLHIYFLGMIFVFLYNAGAAILRAMGDTRRPLIYLIACSAANIILDVVLVCFVHMGIAGVAIATVTAQAISAILTLGALLHEEGAARLEPAKVRFESVTLGKIIRIGLPGGMQSVMNSVSGMIMSAAVNGIGTYAVAGNTAYAKLDGIYWMVSGAFSVAIATFVGQNYGARKYDRMKKSIWVCLGLDAAISAFLSVFFFFTSSILLLLFTSDPLVLEQALIVMKAIAPYYAIVVIYDILGGALRGMGDVFWPMLMNIAGLCGVRALWVLFVSPVYVDLYHIIISCPVSWVCTSQEK